jgi:hypothetical protein
MRYRIASGLLVASAVALTGAQAAQAASTTTTTTTTAASSNIGVIKVGSKCLDVTKTKKIKVDTCILSVRQEPRHLPTVTLSTRWTINANQTISDGTAGCLITKPGKAGSPLALGSCASPVAQWSTQRTFNPMTVRSNRTGEQQAPLAQRTERPVSTRLVGGSSPSRRTHSKARWSSGHLAWFSARRTPVRTRHGLRKTRPHRLWVGSRPFKPGERVRASLGLLRSGQVGKAPSS